MLSGILPIFRMEPELRRYLSLPGADYANFATINNNIRAIKYGAGLTLSGLTCNLSLVNGTAFVTRPSVDLRPYIGFKGTWNDGEQSLVGYLNTVGTGETLDSNLLASLNLTSGWIPSTATVVDSDTFTTTGASGGYVSNALLTIGALYKATLDSNQTGGTTFIRCGTKNVAYDGESNKYATADGTALIIRNLTNGVTVDVNATSSIEKVLTPSATGVTISSTKGGTTPNWASNGGINPNATSFKVTITRE